MVSGCSRVPAPPARMIPLRDMTWHPLRGRYQRPPGRRAVANPQPHLEKRGVLERTDVRAQRHSYTGIKRFATILKAYPRTKFIGHADAFWANISADYHEQEAYPTGPIIPGGMTDKLLSDYPNLFADTSANSANNALSRDPAFTAAFLKRQLGKAGLGDASAWKRIC